MAQEASEPAATDDPQQQPWEESHYEAALAHLERLQEQLDSLRPTIRSIVAPLVQSGGTGSSKAQRFADLRAAATQAATDLKAFREEWSAERTQSLLTKARESVEKDGDLSQADDVPAYGWTERFCRSSLDELGVPTSFAR